MQNVYPAHGRPQYITTCTSRLSTQIYNTISDTVMKLTVHTEQAAYSSENVFTFSLLISVQCAFYTRNNYHMCD